MIYGTMNDIFIIIYNKVQFIVKQVIITFLYLKCS